MAKFCPMFSGSTGNCTIIENKNTSILIDAGVSAKRITSALTERDFDISSLKGIFITHEHSDHISGIRVFCKKNKIPVFMTEGTYNSMQNAGLLSDEVEYRIINGDTDMGDINVSYFHTLHDTPESCGFTFDLGNRKIAVCTDLGVITDEVDNAISDCDLVMLESNHDVNMLQNNSMYPFSLKRRIMSENGHLSNNACAEEIVSLVKRGATRFVLAHLSKENNMPPLAKETTRAQLLINSLKEDVDYQLCVAMPCENQAIIL